MTEFRSDTRRQGGLASASGDFITVHYEKT
jgi:hypothetical protein